VYETQIARPESRVTWLNEKQQKTIRERALMLMANQLGAQAWDIQLPDTSGKMQTLYSQSANYTVVSFWDVHCGKCREEMPRLDSLYQEKWKQRSVKIFAVMVNESAVGEWPAYVQKTGAGWTHVHEPIALRQQTEKEGKANFRQLYDMRSTPTLFLLDSQKKILAKNISLSDLDKLLDLKFAGGK
jgi:thiol-disulfide isomerase/thioredoxin